jgi:hypothetical protein
LSILMGMIFFFFFKGNKQLYILWSKGVSQRLPWSRGSVLAFGTQVRGFAPGRSEKILSKSSFGGEVKPSVPCRSFVACKRYLNVTWKSAFRQNYRTFFSTVLPFAAGCSRVETPAGESWNA